MKTIAALFGLIATLLFAAPAAATPSGTASAPAGCSYGPSTSGGAITTTAGGTGKAVGDDAVELTTKAVDDAVVWKKTLARSVKLAAVTELSYRARKLDDGKTNAAAMPAYRVYLDNGQTLYFEPYYQPGDHLDGTGNPKLDTWAKYDVDAGKFWVTGEGGGSYAGNRTLTQLKAALPDAKVTAVGVGQGTYNAGTVGRFKDVVFKATEPCVKPTESASASSSATAPPTASSSTSTPPAPAGLPVTGAPTGLLLGLGGGVVALGAVLFIAARRRTRFTA